MIHLGTATSISSLTIQNKGIGDRGSIPSSKRFVPDFGSYYTENFTYSSPFSLMSTDIQAILLNEQEISTTMQSTYPTNSIYNITPKTDRTLCRC